MNTSKFLTIGVILLTILTLVGCEAQKMGCTDPRATNYDVGADEDDHSCIYSTSFNTGDCISDIAGNLMVINETDDILVLYQENEFTTCIPANDEGFIINIPNDDLSAKTLQIWKLDDVEDTENPNIENVYRQWTVALSNTTESSERANWLISESNDYQGSGTLTLSYPAIDEYGLDVLYQVDVYLNSKNGALLASLQPGVDDKRISVDYGVHYLYFRYWYSNPNSSSGEATEIGWIEGSTVVFNIEHESSDITIPFYSSTLGKYGEITIYNSTNKPVSIYADDQLIESIAQVDGSTAGLSIIPDNSYTNFIIPVNSYTISAKSIDGSSLVVSFDNINVLENKTAIKYIGIDYQYFSIFNATSETILLYSPNNDYLGFEINAGEMSDKVLIPADIDSLLVLSSDMSKSKLISVNEDTITELNNTKSITMTTAWSETSTTSYKSPIIEDGQTTNMIGTLSNTITVNLSFDYKVSTEKDYDKFSFLIDEVEFISNKSGEITWTSFLTELAPGTHTLKWQYIKDEMFSTGEDSIEIRNITVE